MGETTSHKKMIFMVLMINTIIGAMLQTALSIALPTIIGDLQISANAAQWLTNGYSLVMGIMIPATGFLLRRFKTKHICLTGLGFYLIGLLLAALSTTFPMLLIGRSFQALGSGMFLSMTQVVILTIFPPHKRGTMMGIYGTAAGAAPVLAPTIAGIVIDHMDWHIIFWFTLAVVLCNTVLAVAFMKNVLDTEKQHFDILSFLLSAIGFTGVTLGMGNLGTGKLMNFNIFLPLLVGFLSLILFSYRQLHLKQPFLNIRLLRNGELLLSVILSMLLYAVMIAGSVLIPLYIQSVRRLSATVSGLIAMPGSLAMAAVSPFTGKIYDRWGIRKLAVLGSAFMALGCFALVIVGETTPIWYIITSFLMRSIAIGCLMMPLVSWGMSTIESIHTSHATAILTSLRTIAGAIGSAVFVVVMTNATRQTTQGSVIADVHGIQAAFVGIAVLTLIQFAVAVIFVETKKENLRRHK